MQAILLFFCGSGHVIPRYVKVICYLVIVCDHPQVSFAYFRFALLSSRLLIIALACQCIQDYYQSYMYANRQVINSSSIYDVIGLLLSKAILWVDRKSICVTCVY